MSARFCCCAIRLPAIRSFTDAGGAEQISISHFYFASTAAVVVITA